MEKVIAAKYSSEGRSFGDLIREGSVRFDELETISRFEQTEWYVAKDAFIMLSGNPQIKDKMYSAGDRIEWGPLDRS